jgi:hypothetical protein
LDLWRFRPTLKGWVLIGCGFCSIYGEACDATGVGLGKDAKKVRDAANRAKGLWEIRLRCRNWGLTCSVEKLFDKLDYSDVVC